MRLIDADAFIKKHWGIAKGYRFISSNAVEKEPTVEERKTGHWQSDVVVMRMVYACSVCGERSLYEEGDYDPVLSNYCPFCGAKMEGEE